MSDLGNKEIMAQNILRYMNKKDVTRSEICDALGFKYSTFSEWVNGKKYPRIDKIEMMANYFGVEKSDLVERYNPFSLKGERSVKIPVLGKVAAGIPIEVITDIVDYESIPEKMAESGEYFGLSIFGDSMEPRICKGDVVIVRKQPDIESGQIGIALVGEDYATCKKIMKEEDGLTLISYNPSYLPKFYTWEKVKSIPVQILGRVVELRGKF